MDKWEFIRMNDGIWYVVNHQFNESFMFIVKGDDIRALRSTFAVGYHQLSNELKNAYTAIATHYLREHLSSKAAMWELQGDVLAALA